MFKSKNKKSNIQLNSSKKPFRVFEAGVGEKPKSLIDQAVRSTKLRRNRIFIGSDKRVNKGWFRLNVMVKRLLGKKIQNLTLHEECSTRVLLSLPKESQDLVFESYLSNNLSPFAPECSLNEKSCKHAFFKAVNHALRPGGRLIIIQDKAVTKNLKERAKEIGYTFYAMDLPEDVAKKSSAEYIRARSTSKRRLIFTELQGVNKESRHVKKLIKEGVIKDFDEFAKPTVFILKKPWGNLAKTKIGQVDVKQKDVLRILKQLNEFV